MELDLQNLFGLLCTAVLIGWGPATPPPPCIWDYIRGRYCMVSVGQDGRHFFETPFVVRSEYFYIVLYPSSFPNPHVEVHFPHQYSIVCEYDIISFLFLFTIRELHFVAGSRVIDCNSKMSFEYCRTLIFLGQRFQLINSQISTRAKWQKTFELDLKKPWYTVKKVCDTRLETGKSLTFFYSV